MILRTELAHTRAAFRSGRIDAFKATLIARETCCLSAEDRALVDEQLCADPETVERLSPRQLVGRLQRAAAELDAAAVARRRRRAESDRHVSLRPAPDVMTWLGALLPVKAGVAVHATLHRAARSAKAAGDPRSIGQLMADLLVQRVVHPGLAAAAAPESVAPSTVSTVPVMINLIVRDSVLLGDAGRHRLGRGSRPGSRRPDPRMAGRQSRHRSRLLAPPALRTARHGPPGDHGLQRRAVRRVGSPSSFAFATAPAAPSGATPPIRHADHVVPRVRGGPTTADNGQGLCEFCNYAKEADGWSARSIPGPRHTIEITTPTGHTYSSTADPL